MATHQFTPDEPDSPDCQHCPLPAGNRVHTPTTNTPAPAAPAPEATIDRRDRAVDAEFRDVWFGSGPKSRVFHAIARATAGVTDDELIHKTPELNGMPPNTVRPRRIELADASLVVSARNDQGGAVKRDTLSGRPATVWVLSAAARRLIDAQPRSFRAAG